jgi:hypothetical protein
VFLVTKVNASFQQLTHGEIGQRHGPYLLSFSGLTSARGCGPERFPFGHRKDPDKLGFRPLRVECAPYSWEEILFQGPRAGFLHLTRRLKIEFFRSGAS